MEVLVGSACERATLDPSNLSANPSDMSAVGIYDDPRKLENLINGANDMSNGEPRQRPTILPYRPPISLHHLSSRACAVGFRLFFSLTRLLLSTTFLSVSRSLVET